MSQTLDDFLQNVITQDTRKRLQVYGELVPYLQNERNSVYCEEMDKFVDGLAGWINSSNYKVMHSLVMHWYYHSCSLFTQHTLM